MPRCRHRPRASRRRSGAARAGTCDGPQAAPRSARKRQRRLGSKRRPRARPPRQRSRRRRRLPSTRMSWPTRSSRCVASCARPRPPSGRHAKRHEPPGSTTRNCAKLRSQPNRPQPQRKKPSNKSFLRPALQLGDGLEVEEQRRPATRGRQWDAGCAECLAGQHRSTRCP